MAGNTVGARDLKTHLGKHLRRVRAGHTLVITDRGEPIAEIRVLAPADIAFLANLHLEVRHLVAQLVELVLEARRQRGVPVPQPLNIRTCLKHLILQPLDVVGAHG